MADILDEIASADIRPPRQLDHTIPKELERICLKAMSKRAADRYTTAFDLAEDLRHWKRKRRRAGGVSPLFDPALGNRRQAIGDEKGTGDGVQGTGPLPAPATPADSNPLHTPGSAATAPKVVPKGLRSFDAHDADFFLQLLPGPTDRDGLPESIRFWKTRIEQIDADQTFAVGLIYGPSGCGKSSLVKAGLAPRLAPHVVVVYLEATPDDTEARLLKGLRKRLGGPLAPRAVGDVAELARVRAGQGAQEAGILANSATGGELVETLAALRHGRGLAAGQKVLIVLDQFEQWLHSHRDQQGTELVRALRHCDGTHAQSIVMVRDDFWLAASRFMDALEIPLVQGHNSALTDLFDTRHARRVLVLFGRSLGCLPEVGQAFQPDGGRGVADASASGSQAGKPNLLEEQFLDQAVDGLAEDGKVVSVRLALFAEMVKSKPWTPATLKGIGGIAGVGATFLEETFSASTAPPRHRLHQQAARAVLKALLPDAGDDIKGHRRSRDELLTASGYQRRPDAFGELLRILDAQLRLVTPADDGERGASAVAELARVPGVDSATGAGILANSATNDPAGPRVAPPAVAELVRVPGADSTTGAGIVGNSATNDASEQGADAPRTPLSYQLTHDYLVPSLRHWLTRKQRETGRGRAELRLAERAAAYAARPDARFLPSCWEWPNILLFTKRKNWTPAERRVMRAASKLHGIRLTGILVIIAIAAFTVLETYRQVELRRANDLAAAERRRAETLAESVFTARADGVPYALDNLRPVGHLALERLRRHFDDAQADPVRRLHAAYALADLGHAPLDFLLDAVPGAPLAECRNLVVALEHAGASALAAVVKRAGETADVAAKARYAVVALHLGDAQPAETSLAVHSDPTHRTALIHAYAAWHGDLGATAKTLRQNDDPALRSGLCAALGTLVADSLDAGERDKAVKALLDVYTKAPDGGEHSAAAWALRQWKQNLPAIEPSARPVANLRWFVNGQGMTMAEVPAGKFMMGTPGEPRPSPSEMPAHEVTLTHAFFIAACEVTVEQFRRFIDDAEYAAAEKPQWWQAAAEKPHFWQGEIAQFGPTPDCPVLNVNWFDAVLYCNWLSGREGRKPCYARTGEKRKFKNVDNTEAEYDVWQCDFTADGYRLPTEAEWEYAARAGSSKDFGFGSDEDLLPQYAWFVLNAKSRSWPGGVKLAGVGC